MNCICVLKKTLKSTKASVKIVTATKLRSKFKKIRIITINTKNVRESNVDSRTITFYIILLPVITTATVFSACFCVGTSDALCSAFLLFYNIENCTENYKHNYCCQNYIYKHNYLLFCCFSVCFCNEKSYNSHEHQHSNKSSEEPRSKFSCCYKCSNLIYKICYGKSCAKL